MKKIVSACTVLYATSMVALAPAAHAQTRAQNLTAIVTADSAFAKMSMKSETQVAFNKYMTSDALVFRPRAMRASTAAATHPLARDLILTWQPQYADVSRAGDLGFTTGAWVSGSRSTQADPHFGQYVTVWRKQSDGSFLAVANASVATPADSTSPPSLRFATTAPVFIKSGKPVDDKASLLSADNAFAVALKDVDYAQALKPVASYDIRLLRTGNWAALGINDIVKEVAGAHMTMWLPLEAAVSSSGDLGYTRGSYVASLPNGKHQQGDYLRVWRRAKNGTWQVALEMLVS